MSRKFYSIDEVSFRVINHNYVYVRCPKIVEKLKEDYFVKPEDDGFMALCYIDYDRGISFIVIGSASFKDENLSVHGAKGKIPQFFLMEELVEGEITVLYPQTDEQKEFYSHIDEQLEPIEGDISEVKELRDIDLLDEFRHQYHPDVIEIHFVGEKIEPENMWIRLTRASDDCLYGILLDDPFQDVGYKSGDEISFILVRGEDGKIEPFHIFE